MRCSESLAEYDVGNDAVGGITYCPAQAVRWRVMVWPKQWAADDLHQRALAEVVVAELKRQAEVEQAANPAPPSTGWDAHRWLAN